MKGSTLLIGNGINRVYNSYSWENLIQDLIREVGKENIIHPQKVPFPLLYEEIFLRGLRYTGISEMNLKKLIAEKVSHIKVSDIHRKIVNLNVSNILTTNYDYKIEESQGKKVHDIKLINTMGKSPETKYRIYTYNNSCLHKHIWHIHGEVKMPRTIVLGHEHYSSTLQNMIEFVRSKYNTNNNSKNVKNYENDSIESWIDLFFKSDIHVLGFGFEYTEIDLWWLLNIRARLKNEGKLDIDNKIIYYSPQISGQTDIGNERKNNLLFSHEVIVEKIEADSYEEFYEKAIDEISSRTSIEQQLSAVTTT